jgi:hypothetical protein
MLQEFATAYAELKAAAGNCGTPAAQAAHNKLAELSAQVAQFAATPGEIEEARAQYGSDDIEIDDDASTSPGDAGTWVSAWVWIGVQS